MGTWVMIVVVYHDQLYVPVKPEVFPKLKVAQTHINMLTYIHTYRYKLQHNSLAV